MSSVIDTPIADNKDFDKGAGYAKVWLDDYLQDTIFNQLINKDNKYKSQAIEKFKYFRLNSLSTVFDIDIVDLFDECITHLETCIKSCESREEKYNELNSIFTKAIFSFYKNSVESQLLSISKEDVDILGTSIKEMLPVISHKWRIFVSNKKLLSSSSSLSELIEYIPSSSETSSFCNTNPRPFNNYNPSAGNFQPYLTEEMQNMIKELKIDSSSHIVSNDYQDSTLVTVIDCLIYHHYKLKDIQLMKNFFFEFHLEICKSPLEEQELEDLWVQQTAFIKVSSDDGKNPSSIKPQSIKQKQIQQSESSLLQPELDTVISKGDA